MSWCPDTAKIKKKMLYSSSFDALKHALEGVGKYIQVREKLHNICIDPNLIKFNGINECGSFQCQTCYNVGT